MCGQIVGMRTAPSPVLYMSDVTNQPLFSFLLNLRSLLNAVIQAAIIHSIELAHTKWKDILNQIRLRHCVNSDEKGQAQGGALVSMLFNLSFLLSLYFFTPSLTPSTLAFFLSCFVNIFPFNFTVFSDLSSA